MKIRLEGYRAFGRSYALAALWVVPVNQGNSAGLAAVLWPPRNVALSSDCCHPGGTGNGKKVFQSFNFCNPIFNCC